LRVREKRRLDLAVSMLARVQVEHEIDQRAGQLRAGAAENGEARTREPRRALEIEDAERRAEIPMRLRLEIEASRLAVPAHFDVVVSALADRHARVRQIWQVQHR